MCFHGDRSDPGEPARAFVWPDMDRDVAGPGPAWATTYCRATKDMLGEAGSTRVLPGGNTGPRRFSGCCCQGTHCGGPGMEGAEGSTVNEGAKIHSPLRAQH